MRSSKYVEIADRLAAELAHTKPGARIAGELDIARRFGVGRAAARAAVQELERRLLVRRVQGSGTFANRRIDYVISRDQAPSWQQTVEAAGARPRNVVRGVDLLPLPERVAKRLARAPGTPCYRLIRQSYINDVSAAWAHEWVPADLASGLDIAIQHVESLHTVVSQMAHVRPVRTWCRVSLDIPSRDVLDGLELDASHPAWLVESITCDGEHGPPIWHTSGWMRGDAVRVIVEMGHDSPAATAHPSVPTA